MHLKHWKNIEEYIYYFLLKECQKLGKEEKEISSDALKALKKYPWSGNLREMRNVIHTMILKKDKRKIEIDDIPEQIKEYKKKTIKFFKPLNYSKEDFTQWRSYKIFCEMKERGRDFWEAVHRAYLNRELNKYQLKEIIQFGLKESGGNLKALLPIFKIKEKDYKKFLNFLNAQGIRLRSNKKFWPGSESFLL